MLGSPGAGTSGPGVGAVSGCGMPAAATGRRERDTALPLRRRNGRRSVIGTSDWAAWEGGRRAEDRAGRAPSGGLPERRFPNRDLRGDLGRRRRRGTNGQPAPERRRSAAAQAQRSTCLAARTCRAAFSRRVRDSVPAATAATTASIVCWVSVCTVLAVAP